MSVRHYGQKNDTKDTNQKIQGTGNQTKKESSGTMPRQGRKRKKTRTHVLLDGERRSGGSSTSTSVKPSSSSSTTKIPQSIVMRRGSTSPEVISLVDDLRRLMLPYTALHFQEDPNNRKLTLSQYAKHLALPMGVSHILSFSQSKSSSDNNKMDHHSAAGSPSATATLNSDRLNLRLARLPEGPTLSFRVHRFSLSKDIKKLQRRPMSDGNQSLHNHPPIVVTNNFGGQQQSTSKSTSSSTMDNNNNNNINNNNVPPHIKLLRITFQNLFPAINVATVKLTDCRRVVLFNLVEESIVPPHEINQYSHEATSRDNHQNPRNTRTMIEIRHYAIRATPTGVNRKVRRIVQASKILPNLSKVADIADYIEGNALVSDAIRK
jgi:ribosome biogenesis protein SSF1/2